MFKSLGRITYRRRRLVALAWAALVAVGMTLGGGVMARLSAEPEGDARVESARVAQLLDKLDDRGPEVVAVVDGSPVDDPAVRSSVQAAVADVAGIPGVAEVLDYYSTGLAALASTDGRASLVIAELAKGLDDDGEERAAEAVAERLGRIEAPNVLVGGRALIEREFHTAVDRDLQRGESRALPVALAAMVVIFGGLVAAGLPLIIAFAAVAGALLVLLVATGVMDVSLYAMNVVFMLGLGLGIDYGLLVVSRFREERAEGADIAAAVERTVATAGRTVAFSALTVAVSLAGLFAFDDASFRSFGVAGIGVVVMAMAAATTLLPALLGMWGRRVKPAKPRSSDHGYFYRVAGLVQRRAVPIVVIVGTGLALLAVPFLSARFAHGDARSLPRSSEARAVALLLEERFPARGAEPIMVVARAEGDGAAAYVKGLRTLPGVADVRRWHHAPAGTTVVEVAPEGPSQGEVAQRLVRWLRAQEPGFEVEVGGIAASLIDTKHETATRLPIAFGIIVVATFVLLFLMTGSVAVPVKAIAMNVLSLGASFGGLVWVLQDGHLSGLLDFDPVGSLDLFMPVLIFIFALGLSMDYEVFLLARIKEVYDETGDNDLAVAAGLQRSGRIVTSAALLIVVVFAGFAMGEVLGINELGFGLALAVIVDATVVRTLLVPATMKLLGDRNWWAPRPLRRLHDRYGLREADDVPLVAIEQVAA